MLILGPNRILPSLEHSGDASGFEPLNNYAAAEQTPFSGGSTTSGSDNNDQDKTKHHHHSHTAEMTDMQVAALRFQVDTIIFVLVLLLVLLSVTYYGGIKRATANRTSSKFDRVYDIIIFAIASTTLFLCACKVLLGMLLMLLHYSKG